ncbi:MAG: hypothetical protein C4293_14010, partial [Nitrospiraceae bacterium]
EKREDSQRAVIRHGGRKRGLRAFTRLLMVACSCENYRGKEPAMREPPTSPYGSDVLLHDAFRSHLSPKRMSACVMAPEAAVIRRSS